MDTKIKLRVQGLTNSQIQSGAYALILAEEFGMRRVPIVVGTAEAQSIAIALERIIPPRPLTHDLIVTFSKAYGIVLKEVFIYKFEDGVFYSELSFDDGQREIRLDSRTSDAIAIALRVNCDIYTTEKIVRECGVVLEEVDEPDEEEEDDIFNDDPDLFLSELEPEDLDNEEAVKNWLMMLNEEELQERMEDAIYKEKYEHAKMYKDEIRRREEDKSI